MSPNEYINLTYFDTYKVVEQRIKNVSFCIIAVGGTMKVGKTPLSRYLSWKLGLSLLETDIFLRPVETKVRYDYKYIQDILESKKKAKRHLIVEGCSILPVLREFDSGEIFLIHIEKQKTSGHPSVELIDWGNTEHCSTKEILDVDLDSQPDLKAKANYTISLVDALNS